MFESAKAIRDAQKARMVANARQQEQKRIKKALEKHGVDLSPEVVEAVFDDKTEGSSRPSS